MERVEALYFGDEFGVSFRLDTRLDTQHRYHSALFRGGDKVENINDRTLVFLRYLAKRPQRDLFEEDILQDIWPNSTDPHIVEKYVSLVRNTALGDIGRNSERFIKTLHSHGYRFKSAVRREGDLDSLEAYSEWNHARFHELMNSVKRGREEENEDLRIVTTGISSSLAEINIRRLLRNHLRIQMLFMDPANVPLTDARYSLRTDKTKATAISELCTQIAEIEKLAVEFPRERPPKEEEPESAHKTIRGILEFHVSSIMPCGFYVHTKHWVLMGVFLAQDSYTEGPMLVMPSESIAWEKFRADWDARWKDAERRNRSQGVRELG